MVFSLGAVKKGGFSPFRIVLAGAAVSAFLYAIADGVGIYFKISKDVSMWTAGTSFEGEFTCVACNPFVDPAKYQRNECGVLQLKLHELLLNHQPLSLFGCPLIGAPPANRHCEM